MQLAPTTSYLLKFIVKQQTKWDLQDSNLQRLRYEQSILTIELRTQKIRDRGDE